MRVVLKGVLKKGELVTIRRDNRNEVEVVDENGYIKKYYFNTEHLRKHNLNTIEEKLKKNPISGLNNLGNTCYSNTVVQCLIRTPYFGQYLMNADFSQEKKS